MIGFPSAVRIHLALEPHDMRKSFNGLAALASALVERGLEGGALFAFTNKRRRLGAPTDSKSSITTAPEFAS